MTPDQLILCVLLLAVVVLLVTEWIPLEATALLTMGTLALAGLVPPEQALAGFSSPAVVTIWAVFILSAGLDRTGVADRIGVTLQRLAGRGEIGLTIVLMLGAGLMSAVMNNVAVAALLLPVTMDLARANHIPPSRLLLPLAYGCLLGGLTTMIGTPPNILVSTALKEAGMTSFGLFDFTPVGGLILLGGTAFVVLGGRLLLPRRDVAAAANPGASDLPEEYHLQERTFALTLPFDSPLVGRSLADSRLGAATGLYIIAVQRGEQVIVAPSPDSILQARDRLFVQGRLERFYEIQSLVNLVVLQETTDLSDETLAGGLLYEMVLSEESPFAGRDLCDVLRAHDKLKVVGQRRNEDIIYNPAPDTILHSGDRLLLCGEIVEPGDADEGAELLHVSTAQVARQLLRDYRLDQRLVALQLIDDSDLTEISLEIARIEEILGISAIAIRSGESTDPANRVELGIGNRLFAIDVDEALPCLFGLVNLQVDTEVSPTELLKTARVGLAEAVLSPRSRVEGKTVRDLNFREKYGLGILAIWRAGRAYRTLLQGFKLQFGDAMLLFGPLDRIRALADNPDLIVLSGSMQEPRRLHKAKTASLVLGATLLPVLAGLVPIHLAVIIGSAVMVVTRCLTMEEAYRAIEWRAVFLIAGLLPLGEALEQSGIAAAVAAQVANLAADYGPTALLAGMVLLTFVATCIIPTAALVLLMAPIALSTAAATGLSPHALLMGISMAASASFLTPIAHPANILVMGPGGYRFRDYLRIGFPLTVVVFIIIMVAVPLFWPLEQ